MLQQSESRQKAMLITVIGGCANVVLTALLATALVRWLTSCLSIFEENTYRFASGLPLHVRIEGDDEVSKIDTTFHRMINRHWLSPDQFMKITGEDFASPAPCNKS